MGTKTNKELFSYGLLRVLKEQVEDLRLTACDSNEDPGFLAHKLILSGRSKVFNKMFESDIGKDSSKFETITFSDLKHEELEALIEFMYSDGSLLSEKAKQHAMSLYRAADKYEIPHLRDLCRDTLYISLNPSNALKILELAEIPFDKFLTDAALLVIKINKLKIFTSTEFKAFAENHPNLTVEIVKAISLSCYCGSCGLYV